MRKEGLIGKVAITGSIAAGKSTVVGFLQELGWETLSADDVVKEMWADEEFCLDVGRLFGEEKAVDKNFVRKEISQDGEKRRRLNEFIHTRVMKRMEESSALILEVPLLFEGCLWGRFGGVVVVTCREEVRLIRLKERYGNDGLAEHMRGTQLGDGVKVSLADYVIRTDDGVESVQRDAVLLDGWIRTNVKSGKS